MAISAFRIRQDANNRHVGAVFPSTSRQHFLLSANVGQAITVPSGARYVDFVSTVPDLYVKYASTPFVVPVGNVTDGTAPDLNPSIRALTSATTSIYVISSNSGVVNVNFWSE